MVAAVAEPYNVSPSPDQVKVLKAWYEALHSKLELSREDTRRVEGSLRSMLAELPRTETKGLFGPKRRKKLTQQYEREVEIMREKWGSRILDFTTLPSTDRIPISQIKDDSAGNESKA
jgi:hypothetical protein